MAFEPSASLAESDEAPKQPHSATRGPLAMNATSFLDTSIKLLAIGGKSISFKAAVGEKS